MMLASMMMDVRLEASASTGIAHADIAAGVGAAALLVESVLLMGAQPQVSATVVQLVAVDMVDLIFLRVRKQQPVQHDRPAADMRGRIAALAQMPCMGANQRQVDLIKQKIAAAGEGGDIVAVFCLINGVCQCGLLSADMKKPLAGRMNLECVTRAADDLADSVHCAFGAGIIALTQRAAVFVQLNERRTEADPGGNAVSAGAFAVPDHLAGARPFAGKDHVAVVVDGAGGFKAVVGHEAEEFVASLLNIFHGERLLFVCLPAD
nr:MAG TPA: hypothetical protein [Caudoviricetes sp.]